MKNIIENPNLELCGIVETKPDDIFASLENTGNKGSLDLPIERLRATPVFRRLEDCVEKARPDAVSICLQLYLSRSPPRVTGFSSMQYSSDFWKFSNTSVAASTLSPLTR